MYQGKTHVLFTKYAVPQMIGLLFNSIYMIVDGIFIGNRLGREAMAAAAVSVPLAEILIARSMAVATGAGVLISGQLGRGEKEQVRQVFTISVVCTGAMGGLICILGNVWLNPLAELLGSTPAIHREAICYLWYIVTFSPFLMFSFLLSGLVRNDNRPKLAMFALMVGSLSNVVLDYVFLYPMNMGIAGAALATALAAYLVIGYLMLILLTIFLGMAQGLQPVFSYFAGAGEPERSRALLAFAIRMFLAIGVLCYLLVVLFSREFFSVFNPGDVELVDFMEQKSRPYFCGFFLAGFNILMIAFWQATRHTQRALAVSLSRSVIWLPILTAALPQIFGSEVIWLCHSLSELLTAGIAFGLLRLEEVDREIQMQKGIDRGSAGK